MTRGMCLVLVGGCAVTGRVAPSVTIDSDGKLGAQVLVGVGVAFYSGAHSGGDKKDSSLEMGLDAGGSTGGGEAARAAIIETHGDWFFLPKAPEENGLATRIGARFGIRPTDFPEEGFVALGGLGVAAAALYRITRVRVESDDWKLRKVVVHFVGVEGRCDYLMRFVDQPSRPRGTAICAVGPNYEFLIPFLAGIGRM